MMNATYSPEDDKLRLYSSARLDAETYARVKAAGYGWAPKQECFYAVWSPSHEDIALELAGEIGDEDTSLVDRAEQRAERFEGYSERREADAHAAHAAVSRIADGIPLGQPILIGHHSERHARKDAEKIENGMRRAVKMWETAQYWQYRAAGALRAAKYKELPAVRARRIKTIQADARKWERSKQEAERFTAMWTKDGLTWERARSIANYDHVSKCFTLAEYPRVAPASQYEGMMGLWSALEGIITAEQARDIAVRVHARTIARADRWLAHYANRLAYEQAMLAEQGGTAADRFNIQVGGRVLIGDEWVIVLRVNKSGGRINSVTTNARYVSVRGIEDVKDYREPQADEAEKVQKATALPPLCNYPGEGFLPQTKAEYDASVPKWSDFPKITTIKATETQGRHRVKQTRKPGCAHWETVCVYLTDQKRKDPPVKAEPANIPREFVAPPAEPMHELPFNQNVQFTRATNDEIATAIGAMKETLRAGVQVVSAPQLFPTPAELAARVVEAANIEPGMCVLEPSAGTGNLVRAVLDRVDTEVLAYEINSGLCSQLSRTFPSYKLQARCKDFLEVTDFMGCYPRVIMNPPFANGADIQHIEHAVKFLAPGGRLVAICANGPRQQAKLKPMAEQSGGYYEELPAGAFEQAGTGVNTALLVIEAAQ
jgi:protein-L-isoaspartate O-methyltransferase